MTVFVEQPLIFPGFARYLQAESRLNSRIQNHIQTEGCVSAQRVIASFSQAREDGVHGVVWSAGVAAAAHNCILNCPGPVLVFLDMYG